MGRAVALEPLRRGARVAAVDINATTLAETAASLRRRPVSTHVVNITDRGRRRSPDAVIERFGAVDGLVHCAGIIQPFVRLKDLDHAAIDRVFDVNWWGTLYLTRAFLPVLLDRPEGHIVNVSSMGGFLPVPGQTIYGASKAAVKLFTEGLSSECAGTSVPSRSSSRARSRRTSPPTRASTSRSAPRWRRSRLAGFYLPTRRPGSSSTGWRGTPIGFMVGSDAKLMDRLYRLSPRRAAGFIAKQMRDLLKS